MVALEELLSFSDPVASALGKDEDGNSMPWDEASDDLHFPLQEETKPIDEDLSDRWRRIGEARRKFLLENDRRNGGTKFEIKKTHSIRNYFEIANRVCHCLMILCGR